MENNKNSFVVTVTPITESSDSNAKTDKKKFKNQQGSIKVPNESKEELEALMKITNKKFAHEIIDLLIKNYVEKELTAEQKMKFKLLTEM
ncbi:hypothetical protein CN544_28755 [Bacillus toyonensis]|uniref:hypothetical protein n=1 Tax=Bacillus cereus group TaxID=86661 RepID=UPI000BF05A73|nr:MULTISPECIES: hypothetical protein [Bacillus cereus group]MCU5414655.1 hypothetical protein [Bacillus wiedmannii]PEN76842.1 hypothetical protein CN544_28755 [Bacillus toyonensis]